MIRQIHYGLAQDIPYQTADASVQVIAYTQDVPMAAGTAIEPHHSQGTAAATGLQLPGTETVTVLLLLLVVIYVFARWLRRRYHERADSDFLFNSKLDPAKIRVLNIQENTNREVR